MSTDFAKVRKARWFNEALGIVLLACAAIVFLCLLAFDGAHPSWFNNVKMPPGGFWTGSWGTTLAASLLTAFGLSAFVLPPWIGTMGWHRFRGTSAADAVGKIPGWGLTVLALAVLLDILYGAIRYGGETYGAGGMTGRILGSGLRHVLGSGSIVASSALLAVGIVLATRFSFARAAESVATRGGAAARGIVAKVRASIEERRRISRKRRVERKHERSRLARPSAEDPVSPPPRSGPAARPSIPVPQEADAAPRVVARAAKEEPPAKRPPSRQAVLPMRRGEPGYTLPPLELLNEPVPQDGEEEKELLSRARQLTEKFHEFAVEGQVVAIHPGPVVTTFEFKPEAGVKYSKITSLVDDLCLGLKAESVRIDRMPGRSTVGIEVPNRRQETIFPRELLSSDAFRGSRSRLTLALGKDISGEVYTAELDRMPHLLIAGATGAGKSVGLNGMITSLLYKATPADVRFIMIDTKMIELGIYADIPHLLIPVVTDPKAASNALKWAVREMEVRYRKLASVGVRNLEQFNQLLEEEPDRTMADERTGETLPLERLPYIVIVIDEMADLMMVSSADVEESVMRLAQMARAVGIHLILATQRPSVDVITGTIKANFPSRVAFRVSQRVDSRTIIDQQGAEHLLGRGDMLFLPTGSSRLVRLHGGFFTEAELNRVVAFLKKQAQPEYDESVLRDPEEERGAGENGGDRDAMFGEAVRLVIQEGQCSITLIQRRLRLGYARAARIVDSMEREGVVGPADGARPREVRVGPEYLETLETAP